MRTFASLLFLSLMCQAAAQRPCATQAYIEMLRLDKATAARLTASDAFIKNRLHNSTTGITGGGTENNPNAIIRIPVVVHVLYNTTAQNISDAQIESGIAALNRDFRRHNSDTINTPVRFKAAAADVQMEFYLATADPNGVASRGIVRKQTNVPAFNMDDKIKYTAQGGDDAWDSRLYLNIWIGNTRRLLGYATMPGSDAAVDGVVINFTAFGTIGKSGPYHLGRTAVHEVGHWLGLHHLWGDEACGDDEVDDTPKQGGYTAGCPTIFRSSCSNAPDGDMYMNYMDFTNDACMNLFTHGQRQRMRTQFAPGGPRYGMLASRGLDTPWVDAVAIPEADSLAQVPSFHIFPNPTSANITLQYKTTATCSGVLYLVSSNGTQLQKIIVTSGTQNVNLTGLKAGLYFIHGAVNGTKIHQKVVKVL